jgi:hypothetical protein
MNEPLFPLSAAFYAGERGPGGEAQKERSRLFNTLFGASPLVVITLSALQRGQTPPCASLFGGLFILAGVTTVALSKRYNGSEPSTKRR